MARFMVPRYIEFVDELPKTQATQRIIKADFVSEVWAAHVGQSQGFRTQESAVSNKDVKGQIMTTDRKTSATGCPAGAERLESLAGVSFIDPAIQEKPFAYYRALREGDPVHYEDELGMYLVSRHEDSMDCAARSRRVLPRAGLLPSDGSRPSG